MTLTAVGHSTTLLDIEQSSFTTTQLAALLNVSRRTLKEWRNAGRGPLWTRAGSHLILYSRDDVMRWLHTNPPINTQKMRDAVTILLARNSTNGRMGTSGRYKAVGTGRKKRRKRA